nr:unnamed protein product [Meloidogyne enterolobii]
MTTPSPHYTPSWGLVQNALTGEFIISNDEPLPDIFWVRISKEKFYEVMEAIKKMDCVDRTWGSVHPFLEDESMEDEGEGEEATMAECSLEIISVGNDVPEWFAPQMTSTRNPTPDAMDYADDSSVQCLDEMDH